VTINFGLIPVRASFTMSSDADFYQVVSTSDDSNFPVGCTMVIKILDSEDVVLDTWSATISGSTATFEEVKADVATVLDGDPVAARVYYQESGGPELLLAQGLIHDVSP
jgi:hypothetical protein